MKYLIELKRTIDKSLGLDIVYNSVVNNFEWNRIWVTELGGTYFEHKKRLIEDYIDKYIDYNNRSEVNLLLELKNKINNLILEIESTTYENLFNQNFCRTTLNGPLYWPNQSPMEFPEEDPFNLERLELEILEMIKSYHDIEMDDLLQDTQGIREAFLSGKADNGKIYNEDEVKLIFAKARLFHILWMHQNTLKYILGHIEYYFEAINSLQGDDSQDTEPKLPLIDSPYQLQFNLTKEEVAIFFENLYKNDFIETIGNSNYKKKTALKEYIDNANLYYLNGQKRLPVKDINKEFSKIKSGQGEHAMDRKEGELLTTMILKFSKSFSVLTPKQEIELLEKLVKQFTGRIKELQ